MSLKSAIDISHLSIATSVCPASNGEQAIARPQAYSTAGKSADQPGRLVILERDLLER